MSIAHGGDLFAIARRHGWPWQDVVDFSASINPLGPSPHVRPAIVASLDRIAHYPERQPHQLCRELAGLWNVDAEQILLGNGATELIFFFARMVFARMTGTQAVALAVPVFSEFHRAFPAATEVPLATCAGWPTDRLLILTRPANPTGSTLDLALLGGYLARTTNPVLLDESFLEFTGATSAATFLATRPNLWVLRSLTKFYALPGLRIGALLSNAETIADWQAGREPWQVNVLAEAAARAAVADTDHAARTVAFVRDERSWFSTALRAIPGVAPQPSDANFLLVRLAYPAAALADFLLQRKVIVRVCTGWPGVAGEAVRVAVRTRSENQLLLQHWTDYPCA